MTCAALLLFAVAVPLWPQGSPQKVHITLLGTTDLHGNIFPVDYYTNQPANRGLAKIATLVKQVRGEQKNVLLLDSGDTIQGTPLAYYFARKDVTRLNPTIAMMNAMAYDAMAVGNHEFNFGLEPLWKAKRESKFPWLAANLKQKYVAGVGRIEPYIVKNVDGVRVAIVGFITPGVPRWEIPANYNGYEFENIVEAAKRVIPEVRAKADVVVVLAHSGLERDPQTGQTYSDQMENENAVGSLAEQVPGIDVIFFGHSHRELPTKLINGVLLVQASNWGQSLARADVEMEQTASGWKLAAKRSTVIPVTGAVAADAEIVKLAQPYHDATEKYLETPVATSSQALDAATARYEDHPFVDMIHKVQMEYGKADVSLATMFFTRLQIPAGQVTLRQIAGLYIYENTLYTVEMNGKQLREVLEHAAEFFPAWPFKEGDRVRLPGFNADCAEGVEYTMDLTQPVGQRIRDLKFKGKPLADDQKLRVATNNYRYSGGGRYTVLQGLPVEYRSPIETRELIIEYVSRTGKLLTEANGNWKIVPKETYEALVREARQRESGNTGGP
ncbi:MAG: 5'-nucleotidase C-terminal domain-containing protein [Acidobacteria bacterium]|nr:5'-nucleotidase C-terminal domain-containing protein [Acidobacteriota bacterium]MCL5288454.1 5'-nucleotidase C-terminal domain-containing protein [Acidobacteriota bacterium]